MILQERVSTRSAFFIGELKDAGKLLKQNFVITLCVLEGAAKFIFSDQSGEARLIFLADEGTHQFRAEDFEYCLKGSEKLRLSAAEPRSGNGPKSVRPDLRLTYQCSITTATREEI